MRVPHTSFIVYSMNLIVNRQFADYLSYLCTQENILIAITMIGLIIWAILIIIIVICVCPGFITALLVNGAIVLGAYGLIWWIIKKIKNSRKF